MHQKRKNLSKIQILEFSILFIILNNFLVASKKLEELSEINFLTENNEALKNKILNSVTHDESGEKIMNSINTEYEKIINTINENTNIQMIIQNKSDQDVLNLLTDLILDHKEQNNLKKIESLEQKLINNLDENSYSELIKLKSQLNRD